MKSSLPAVAACVLALFASPASAQAPTQTSADIAQLRTCVLAVVDEEPLAVKACEKPIMTACDQDYAMCYNRLLAGWDGLLNDSFRQLTRGGVLVRADARRLQDAQRAWIKYRDADCKFYAGVWPGSRPPYQNAACIHRLTRERAATVTVRLQAARALPPPR